MSQEQPKSIHHYRALRDHMGCELALINAASDVDNLTDQLGRRLDLLRVVQGCVRGSVFGAGLGLGLAVAWMMACTTIGHEKVEGWPELKVVEHYVPHHVMRDRCTKYAPWGTSPEACAEFNLIENRCDIWFSADFPPPKAFIEHERLHCAGYDHPGESTMADLLNRYKGAK